MDGFFASLPTPERVTASINRFLSAFFQDIDQTVPGTTETILLLGVVIVLIIVVPIVVARRRWMR